MCYRDGGTRWGMSGCLRDCAVGVRGEGVGVTKMARGGCQKDFHEGVGVRKITMRELVSER